MARTECRSSLPGIPVSGLGLPPSIEVLRIEPANGEGGSPREIHQYQSCHATIPLPPALAAAIHPKRHQIPIFKLYTCDMWIASRISGLPSLHNRRDPTAIACVAVQGTVACIASRWRARRRDEMLVSEVRIHLCASGQRGQLTSGLRSDSPQTPHSLHHRRPGMSIEPTQTARLKMILLHTPRRYDTTRPLAVPKRTSSSMHRPAANQFFPRRHDSPGVRSRVSETDINGCRRASVASGYTIGNDRTL